MSISSLTKMILNRTLGVAYVDGKNVILEMVKAGLAEICRVKFAPGFDNGPYQKAEGETKTSGKGMWSLGDKYMSPQEWRKNQKLKMKNITEAIVMPVQITVSKGKCQGKYHYIGQKFTVDGQTPGGMCMGAWDAISPYVVTLLYGGNFPWENEKGVAIIHCPDPKGITLQLKRI